MSIRDKKANKGEWAEVYVLCRLLGEGRLYSADDHMERIPGSYVEVLRVIREEIVGEITQYKRRMENGTVEISTADGETILVSTAQFLEKSQALFDYLCEARGRSLPAPDGVSGFLDLVKVTKPKAPSTSSVGSFGGKTDIVIRMRDVKTALVSTMGFSIKAQFASPPTLYNAGTSTQFLYEVEGMDDASMREFNSLTRENGNRDWASCVEYLKRNGLHARFIGTAKSTTAQNLLFIRESMPSLMACLYRHRLLEDTDCKGLPELCSWLEEADPLSYPDKKMYEKALKDLLMASFSGMTGTRRWDGTEQINGGYIVVKPGGDVLCYHSSDRERFRDYLFRQSFLEYVSCKKFGWGTVSKDPQERYVLPLNGSIRFRKDFVEP